MQLSNVMWFLPLVMLAIGSLELVDAKQDYYQILGINRKAKPQDIKRAFRKLAAKYHPDKNKDPGAEEKFKEINEAHEVLVNPEKRRHYDTYGHTEGPGATGPSGHGSGFSFHFDTNDDILHNFFGHGQEFAGERSGFHFNHFDGGRHHDPHQHSFYNFFEEEDPGFGDFFGGADPHRFGDGSSFFGSHFGGGGGHSHHQQARASGSRCRTVTQRVGNMVTTYTQCS